MSLAHSGRLKGAETVTLGVLPPHNGKGPRFLIAGEGEKPFLRMNSNSYLGLSFEPRVIAAEEEAVRRYGAGPGAVRFISGTWAPHIALERRLAAFHGREAAMLFSSAYATVMGVLPQLITDQHRGDQRCAEPQLHHQRDCAGAAGQEAHLRPPRSRRARAPARRGRRDVRARRRRDGRRVRDARRSCAARCDHAARADVRCAIRRRTSSWWPTTLTASAASARPAAAPRR